MSWVASGASRVAFTACVHSVHSSGVRISIPVYSFAVKKSASAWPASPRHFLLCDTTWHPSDRQSLCLTVVSTFASISDAFVIICVAMWAPACIHSLLLLCGHEISLSDGVGDRHCVPDILLPTEILPIRILYPTFQDCFIRFVESMLQEVQAYHLSDWYTRTAFLNTTRQTDLPLKTNLSSRTARYNAWRWSSICTNRMQKTSPIGLQSCFFGFIKFTRNHRMTT